MQSLGYGVGLAAVPVFFLTAHFFSVNAGFVVGIVTALGLIIALKLLMKRC